MNCPSCGAAVPLPSSGKGAQQNMIDGMVKKSVANVGSKLKSIKVVKAKVLPKSHRDGLMRGNQYTST